MSMSVRNLLGVVFVAKSKLSCCKSVRRFLFQNTTARPNSIKHNPMNDPTTAPIILAVGELSFSTALLEVGFVKLGEVPAES